MSDIFDHELDAFESLMDQFEDSPIDLMESQNKTSFDQEEDTSSPFYYYFKRFPDVR